MLYMDEIIIEEKKYVSSRQAAKITGYAKDYIGQLCREGRVPARLVGRSWYVLESAIQDHRFGNHEAEEPKEIIKSTQSESFSVSETWEFPRYEASHPEVLQTVNRLEDSGEEGTQEQDRLHESWKEWFDHVASTLSAVEEPAKEAIEEAIPQIMEEETVNVPLRVMPQHNLPERELFPRQVREQAVHEYRSHERVRGSGWGIRALRVVLSIIALSSVAVAVIGSGFADSYMASDNPVLVVTGVEVYNK